MSSCRSCGASITWAVAESGKRIPVDAQPVANGNLRLSQEPGDGSFTIQRARVTGSTIDLLDPTDDGARYVSHYATCPDAADWRR